MKNKNKATLVAVALVVGAFLLAFGIVFQFILDKLIDSILHQKLALKKGTIAYKMWQVPPVPIAFNIYVFDLVNAEEVAKGLAAPLVMEKGPYVHRMHIHKTNITRHDSNDTISYVQPQSYHFDREASVGDLNDTFTTLNIPFVTVASTLQHWPSPIQFAVNEFFEAAGEKPFMQLTVNDIFWGYKDPILSEFYKIAKKLGIHVDFLQKKFGFFYGKNNTGDGYYNVFSGVNGNLDNYCQIDFWNRQKKMNIWTTDKANEIAGTDGALHPPYVTSDSKLKIFDAYLHRTLNMKYVKPTSYKGLDTLRFVVPYSEFDNATMNPDMAGFCTPNTDYCIPSGCYNLSVASYGAPMFVSMPHFVGGDPWYQEQVLGFTPDPEKHQPFYDIHGLTGVSIKGSRRYQINVQMKSYKHFSAYKKVPLAYLPIIWIDGASIIDDNDVASFRDQIQHLLAAMVYVRYFIIGIGGLLMCVSVCLAVYWRYKYNKEKKVNKVPKEEGSQSQNGHMQVQQCNGTSSESASEREPLLKYQNGH